MRVHVAAIGQGFRSKQSVQRFRILAEKDSVGLHPLVEDPEEADVVLVVDLHATEHDVFPTSLRRSRLPRSWRSKVRVWDQRDNGYYTHPGLYVAPAPRLVKKRRQKAAPYISTIAPVVEATTEPDLLYSFIGTRTYPVRGEIFGLNHPRAAVEETRGINFFTQSASGAARRLEAQNRHTELVGRSKFVLCPRGLGPSTFRLYETMSAGRVPVIISDRREPLTPIDRQQVRTRPGYCRRGGGYVVQLQCACVSVIVAGAEPRSKSIVVGEVAVFACPTAQRSVPATPLSAVLVTSSVESSRRSSRGNSIGFRRRQFRFAAP